MSHDGDDAFPIMPPSDAAKSDDLAIQDLSREVTSTGNIRLAAKRLAQSAQAEKLRALKERAAASSSSAAAAQPYARWADDPEEAEYLQSTSNLRAQTEHVEDQVLMSDEEEEEEEKEAMGHMQEVVDGLWVGDLVAANDDDQLEKHGIVSYIYVACQRQVARENRVNVIWLTIRVSTSRKIYCLPSDHL